MMHVERITPKVKLNLKPNRKFKFVFNVITNINESKTLAKHLLCESKCKFHSRKSSSNQNGNNNKCR